MSTPPNPDMPKGTEVPPAVENAPSELFGAEQFDEDMLEGDPLDEHDDPPDTWSTLIRYGTTPAELREGADMDERLSQEEPDRPLEAAAEQAVAGEPAEEPMEIPTEDMTRQGPPVVPHRVTGENL